jgi:hypothetical protein
LITKGNKSCELAVEKERESRDGRYRCWEKEDVSRIETKGRKEG